MAVTAVSAASVARQTTPVYLVGKHDADLLFNSASSSSSSSTPAAFFPDLSTIPSAAFPPADLTTTSNPDHHLFYDPLLIPSSMFPGDPALSAPSFDNTILTATSAGYPCLTSADGIDWTALGCLPASHGELAGNNGLESQSSAVGSPDHSFDPSTHTHQTALPPTPLPIQPATAGPEVAPTMPSATSTTTTHSHKQMQMQMQLQATTTTSPSPPSRDSTSTSPKETASRVSKRQLNTMAARRYRQRRLDRMTQLEEELEAVKRERDELRMRVSKLEGETDALRSMLKEKGGK
ncbi:hypothetical protein BJY01DRAFT_255279 [Aspergillus pseudoustus]|uniref:BZIP domain-containing protein n=1 Tax=Aspergillus pseudoustus TaxID=1810923 RepID=A0ABR4ILH7_9EURO